ncbi:SWIM zinc finger family protein [Tritrichomonas foetus]|uniref:SWIM zinc finger family protein n=1 Tax=Tritrichomonas foetus TaxID=1144522 RepID=A0A1J4JPA6_9EUKA|nr:SWIM zinc finger family protein [Tritrichomonas foetus]|eukprot:OHT00961.1 SWIM zinc finger family protein [Tritrichomonas foetus]
MDFGEIAFKEILRQIEIYGITHQTQQFLNVLLPKSLVDRSFSVMFQESKIKCCIAKLSDRCVWIFNSKDNLYYVFIDDDSTYCSCPSYQTNILKENKYPYCKHIIAAFICNALKNRGDISQFRIEDIDDSKYSTYLANTVIASLFGKKKITTNEILHS